MPSSTSILSLWNRLLVEQRLGVLVRLLEQLVHRAFAVERLLQRRDEDGGVDRGAIETLRAAAGSYRPQLALGVATVAKGRQRAGNLVPHTDLASEILCSISSEKAARIVDVAFENLPTHGPKPAFEILQQRLLAQFALPTEHVSQ